MARIPVPRPRGQEPGSIVPDAANSGFFNIRPADTSQPGRDMQALGAGIAGIGSQIEALRQEAKNEERKMLEGKVQLRFDEFETGLHDPDPDKGVFSRSGERARGTEAELRARYEAMRPELEQLSSGMDEAGKIAMEQYAQGRFNALLVRGLQHETKQLQAAAASNAENNVGVLTQAMATNWANDVEYGRLRDRLIKTSNDVAAATGRDMDHFAATSVSAAARYTANAVKTATGSARAALEWAQRNRGDFSEVDWSAFMDGLDAELNKEDALGHAQTAYAHATGGVPVATRAAAVSHTVDGLFKGLVATESVRLPDNTKVNVDTIFDLPVEQKIHIANSTSPRGKDKGFGVTQVYDKLRLDPSEFGAEPYKFEGVEITAENVDDVLRDQLRLGKAIFGGLMKKYKNNVDHALMAYVWGGGNVDKWLRGDADAKPPTNDALEYVQLVKQRSGIGGASPAAGIPKAMSAEQYLANITDPDVRRLAQQEYSRLQNMESNALTRRKNSIADRVTSSVLEAFLKGGAGAVPEENSPELWSEEERQALGTDAPKIVDWIKDLRAGKIVEDVPEYYNEMVKNLNAGGPVAEEALRVLLDTGRYSLKPETLVKLIDRFNTAIAGEQAGYAGVPYRDQDISAVVSRLYPNADASDKDKENMKGLDLHLSDYARALAASREGEAVRTVTRAELEAEALRWKGSGSVDAADRIIASIEKPVRSGLSRLLGSGLKENVSLKQIAKEVDGIDFDDLRERKITVRRQDGSTFMLKAKDFDEARRQYRKVHGMTHVKNSVILRLILMKYE